MNKVYEAFLRRVRDGDSCIVSSW